MLEGASSPCVLYPHYPRLKINFPSISFTFIGGRLWLMQKAISLLIDRSQPYSISSHTDRIIRYGVHPGQFLIGDCCVFPCRAIRSTCKYYSCTRASLYRHFGVVSGVILNYREGGKLGSTCSCTYNKASPRAASSSARRYEWIRTVENRMCMKTQGSKH